MSESGVQPHILVVDDARDIREPLVRYLRESGYRASAADGAQAARRADAHLGHRSGHSRHHDAGRRRTLAVPVDSREFRNSRDHADRARR